MPDFSTLPYEHPTPSLVIDLPTVRQNIARMQAYGSQHQLKIRPHTKTHKSLPIARLQLEAGAAGLTVAKAGEADVMSQVCQDIFVAYPAVGHARMQLLMETARQAHIRVAVDSSEAADLIDDFALSKGVKVGALVDIDVGFHRTGTVGIPQAIALANHVAKKKAMSFEGIMCFPGHLLPTSDPQSWESYENQLGEVIEGMRREGHAVHVVSGGSTPTAYSSHRNRWLNEIRPGTYVYNDLNEVRLGVATLNDCAAQVLATVISRSGKDKFVIDAGSKTLSSDRCGPAPDSGWGYVNEFPDAKIVRLSEEHGEVQLPPDTPPPKIGSRVTIVPNHICVCVNLQSHAWLKEGDQLELVPIDARGKIV